MLGAARCKASQLIGSDITNTKNENLGTIEDIVLDSSNHTIAYAVVAFGGFLGFGDKYHAMPWRLLEISQRGTDDVPRTTLGLDRETLKAAPGFDKRMWPDMANATWTKQVDEYYRSRSEKPRTEGATEPKGGGVDGKVGVDRVPTSKSFAHRRVSRVIGMNVVDPQHGQLADIEDLIVNTSTAKIDAVVLSFGGILGMGERLALVPAEALVLDHEKEVLVFACSKAGLEGMALPGNKLPSLNKDEWLVRSRLQCAKAREEQPVKNGDVVVVAAGAAVPVPYADFYDLNKIETVKGTILTVGSVRIGDVREERVRLRVRASDGRDVIVYAAPWGFEEQLALGLRAGRPIEVTGSPAKYGNQTVLVAGSIVLDGKTARLRDDQGHATWIKK